MIFSVPVMTDSEEIAISMDFGGTSVKFAIIQGTEMLDRAPALQTQEFATPELLIEAMVETLKDLVKKWPAARAVGMGIPCVVDYARGVVGDLTNVPGWHEVPICRIVSEATGLPAFVENDANCMAYAEWKLGAGVGYKDIVCLTIGTGVGSGIVLNNQFYRGHFGGAGEMGQSCIDYKGRVGHYGNRGALEDYIGNREIAADAQAAYAAVGISKTIEECGPRPLEDAARAGDPVAQQLWREIARKLASALINCCYIINPHAFVIGGGVAGARELLFDPLREYMKAQLLPSHFERIELIPAKFGGNAGLIGAARYALDCLANKG